MTVYYKSQFLTVSANDSLSLVITEWDEMTKKMHERRFKDEIVLAYDVIALKKPKFYLLNTENLYFQVPQEEQKWVNDNFMSKLSEFGVQKMAIFNNKFETIQGSFRETMQKNVSCELAFFKTQAEAYQWFGIEMS
ncbi:MAG: hypothetical protein EAZ97_08115 [Bacteroidetes bacterium]|nr:MAG: hypothetical protein EAZ97_08115 [Bacteroidota bacterium]